MIMYQNMQKQQPQNTTTVQFTASNKLIPLVSSVITFSQVFVFVVHTNSDAFLPFSVCPLPHSHLLSVIRKTLKCCRAQTARASKKKKECDPLEMFSSDMATAVSIFTQKCVVGRYRFKCDASQLEQVKVITERLAAPGRWGLRSWLAAEAGPLMSHSENLFESVSQLMSTREQMSRESFGWRPLPSNLLCRLRIFLCSLAPQLPLTRL